MASELFVDTSGWYPIADPTEPTHHAVARALREKVGGGIRVVTTNLVVAETHALLMRRIHRDVALAFVQRVVTPPQIAVSSSPEIEERATHDWLERYTDQNFTFTDAVSFAVMNERRIQEALTLDHRFAAAGFTMIPTAES